ncbi:MAG: hypothetical protein EAZ55_08885 [Cytophagales bacterium]|nr:MAG: hypothetical protein EAZ55_08885 [Cytophagales bacterium]
MLWVLLALTTFACSSKKAEDAFASFQRGANGEIVLEGEIKTDLTLTATNKYILRGFVYVTSGATLTIEPGTIIKGEKATKGTLIIEQGAKIQAIGTSTSPIVFTSDQAKGARNYGDWGGLVIIGKAPHNRPSATAFEGGIRGSFGTFNDANDNSGTLKYVRVEFCGIALTTASNSEINGLTLYAVGKGTTIEYVQVSYSGDDSFEWFGGNADAKYLIAYRGWDDDFDTDFGFTGNVQFGLVLRNPAIADQSGSNAFESDNFGGSGTPATAANDGLPLTYRHTYYCNTTRKWWFPIGDALTP